MGETIVIGLGNPLRGDDGIGLEVARTVAARCPGLDVIEHDREPLDLIELWADHGSAFVIDAVAGEEPGRIHRLDASAGTGRWQRPIDSSSHAFDLGQVIELAGLLGRLPPRLQVLGIEGSSFGAGTVPTAAVRAAGRRVVAELLDAARIDVRAGRSMRDKYPVAG